MDLFNTIVKMLKKPFPEQESRYGFLKIITIISVFVTFFLYIFQPFGISTIASHKFLICLGFGSMTFLGALIYEITVGQLLKVLGIRAHWTFGKWILYNLGIVLCISFFNFLFIRLAFFGHIQWELFPAMLYGTFMIGIIPLVVFGGITLIKQESKYQNIAAEINQRKPTTSSVKNDRDIAIFNIPASQIKYVEALQNYIKIGFINAEGKLLEKIERATLKQIIEEAKGTSIIRCHRSFVVNREAIVSVSGNAQGLLLCLSDCDKIIPVSRSRVPIFK